MTARLLRVAEARIQPAVIPPPPPPGAIGSVDQIVRDMYAPVTGPFNVVRGPPWAQSDGHVAEVNTTFSWWDGADSFAFPFAGADGTYVDPWFWCGKWDGTSPTYDVRFELKTPIFQFLVAGVWVSQPALGNPDAHDYGVFTGTGTGNDHGDLTRRSEAGDGATAFSWPLNSLATATHDFCHGWWNANGTSAVVANTTAFHISCQARLITNGGGDPSTAKFLAVMGADDIHTPGGPFTDVGGFGEGRAKFLTSSWQAVSFTSGNLTEAQIRANPPTVQT